MGKEIRKTLEDWIRERAAIVEWALFLWGSRTTAESYWAGIALQEDDHAQPMTPIMSQA